jgi:hypothetical protein
MRQLRRKRLMVAQHGVEARGDESVVDGAEPCRLLGMVRAHLVKGAGVMSDVGDGHDCKIR